MTGLELKVLRVGSRVKQKDLAVAMGISRPRASMIEAQERISPEVVIRYVAAVAALKAAK